MFAKELDNTERTIAVIRKHWFIFAVQAFLLCLLAIAPIIAAAVVPDETGAALSQLGITANVLVFFYLVFLMAVWILVFICWTVYYLDAWVVTNRRVIDINQRSLFVRDMTTLMLEKVQDVTVEVRGLFATLLGYGTLVLRTAGENDDIRIEFAAHPQYARDRIMACQRASQVEISKGDGV